MFFSLSLTRVSLTSLHSSCCHCLGVFKGVRESPIDRRASRCHSTRTDPSQSIIRHDIKNIHAGGYRPSPRRWGNRYLYTHTSQINKIKISLDLFILSTFAYCVCFGSEELPWRQSLVIEACLPWHGLSLSLSLLVFAGSPPHRKVIKPLFIFMQPSVHVNAIGRTGYRRRRKNRGHPQNPQSN